MIWNRKEAMALGPWSCNHHNIIWLTGHSWLNPTFDTPHTNGELDNQGV